MTYFARISGVGSYVPDRSLTNFDLEKMLDTTDEWIVQRTGIHKRHWVEPHQTNTDLAYEASMKALRSAGIEADQLDMIIFATLSPDFDFPGTGCFLQARLGVPGISVLDIRQQCTGYLYALSIADKFIRSGSHQNILIVGSEVHSKGLDKTPNGRAVSVLFGDGAGATVVTRTQLSDAKKDAHIIASNLHADGSFAKELWIAAPGNGFEGNERISKEMLDQGLHYPQMNGKAVFTHAVKRMAETLSATCQQSDVSLNDVDVFLFHQANIRINDKVGEILGLNPEKVFNTIQDYGNTTAATIPLGMDKAIEAGVLRPGMLVASAAFGSGFTWASALWRT